jgi:hypothetical protein
MSQGLQYRQCHLQKKDGDALWEQTSWIPEPYCVVGKVVKLKDANGNWEDGWKVVSASEPKPAKFIEGHERDYLKNRKASDI